MKERRPVKTTAEAVHSVLIGASDRDTLEKAGVAPTVSGILTDAIWQLTHNGGL